MSLANPSTPQLKRTPRDEALAARVRHASQMSVEALHASADDRRFLHELEWGQATEDTLADIDEVADSLQGIAAWVVGGTRHSQPLKALNTLADLGRHTAFDLRAKLLGERRQCTGLLSYIGRLEELRLALLDYFNHAENSANPTSAPGANESSTG